MCSPGDQPPDQAATPWADPAPTLATRWTASRGRPVQPIVAGDQLPDHLDDVGPGWAGILTALHETILGLGVLTYRVGQVKEKFGALRVYLDDIDQARRDGDIPADLLNAIDQAVEDAEEKSRTVCELCGQPGRWVNTGYWGKTLCPTCSGTGSGTGTL